MHALEQLKGFIHSKGWEIFREREIANGYQVVITDGTHRVPVNVFHTGTIQIQGKDSPLKEEVKRWKETLFLPPKPKAQNRSATYYVFSEGKREHLWSNVIPQMKGVVFKDTTGPAEIHRVEIRREGSRVTITQYDSGNLLVQGLESPLFEEVCDTLDIHLGQDFTQHVQRFIPEETSWEQVLQGIAPALENQAVARLRKLVSDPAVIDFLHEKDRKHLVAGVGVLILVEGHDPNLPDYSPVVTGFAKAFEGFMIRLALHMGLTTQEKVEQGAKNIQIGNWIKEIEKRLPDKQRYGDVYSSLEAAWQTRHKALHSDPVHPYSVIETLADALDEIHAIVRAMKRAYKVFVDKEVALVQKERDKEGASDPPATSPQKFTFRLPAREDLRAYLEGQGYSITMRNEEDNNVWEFITDDLKILAPRKRPCTVVITGPQAGEFVRQHEEYLTLIVGTDEAGKGDVFGPLVVVGVLLTPRQEKVLRRLGVRDSKQMSRSQILDLAKRIRESCPTKPLVLRPEKYNETYENHGNLNRLLAWAHARVIRDLSDQYSVHRVIVDQFGDASLLPKYFEEGGSVDLSQVDLIQTYHAEAHSIAVSSASIVARALFLEGMEDLSSMVGVPLQRGSSDPKIKAQLDHLFQAMGAEGLRKVAKMHFRPVREILGE